MGGLSALGLLAALSPKFAQAQQVPPTDARLNTGLLNDDRVNSTWPAYEAALKANGASFEAVKYEGTLRG